METKKVVMGPMRRVTKQNEPTPIIVGLLRRVLSKNKELNSLNLPKFKEQVISRAIQEVLDSLANLFGIEKK